MDDEESRGALILVRLVVARLDERTQGKVPAIISTNHRRFFLFSCLSFQAWDPRQEDRSRGKIREKPRQPDRQDSALGALTPVLSSCPFAASRCGGFAKLELDDQTH